MYWWIIIALAAYLLLAAANMGDKLLVESVVPDAKAYVFLVSLPLGLIAFVLPIFPWPGLELALLALVAGCIFNFGLYWLYASLKFFDSSQIIPAVSGLVPVFSAVILGLFFGGKMSQLQLLAFALLVFGSVVISFGEKLRFDWRAFYYSALAAMFFSLGFVLSRQVFLSDDSFWRAFLWIKFGGFFTAVFFLLTNPGIVRKIGAGGKAIKGGFLVYLNQIIGIAGNLMQNYAIAISASLAFALPLINALQGAQYIFVGILAIILNKFFPGKIKEDFSRSALIRTVCGVILLCIGLIILSL
jgi:drug/metabolite transporter (DMT)-like permease